MADLAQQRAQKLLAPPFRRHFANGGFHHHLVRLVEGGMDLKLEDAIIAGIDFQHAAAARRVHVLLEFGKPR
ncbi:hypothetical protein D3C86_1906980 [compost metagenome]